MLTKKERETIAERLRNCNEADYYDFYEAVTGEKTTKYISLDKDVDNIANVILDLCDTSNMIELPLDKDGKVIHVGDIVYYGSTIYMVKKIIYNGNEWEIQFFDDRLCISIYAEPNDLTHKQPVTAKSLAQRIRDVLRNDHSEMSPYTSRELVHIANDLERLGDSND